MSETDIVKTAGEAMAKAVEHTRHQFGTLHTGKASPAMVENVSVTAEAYGGGSMSLNNLAAVTTPDSRMIQITPWDKSVIRDIEKAIIKANLGLNPSVDGAIIRVPVPELSKERRKDLAKSASGMAEDGRVAVRQARQEAMKDLKAAQKDGMSEDDVKRDEKEVQALTDRYTKEIDGALSDKEKELLTV